MCRIRCWASAEPPPWSLHHRQNELAEVASLLHFGQDFACLRPVKLFADGLELRRGDGSVHLDEIAARAYVDALNANHLMQNGTYAHGFGVLCEHADLRYGSAGSDGLERAAQGAQPAYFDYQVYALAVGLIEHPAVPVGMITVVQAGVKAETYRSLQFLEAARNTEHSVTHQLGEVQREDGDAAGSQDEHFAAGMDIAGAQSVPRGHCRTWQRCRLL